MKVNRIIIPSFIILLAQLLFVQSEIAANSEESVDIESSPHPPLETNSNELESPGPESSIIASEETPESTATEELLDLKENEQISPTTPPANTIEAEQLLELAATNIALVSRIGLLERKLDRLEGLLSSVRHDVHFHHPTMEVQFVDMQVVAWSEAVRNGLRKVAIQFQAGYSLGAVSTWEFSLANESDALTVNLLLIDEKYGKTALFAGFTSYVLDTEGNLFSQANALPVNFLDGNGRNLHLPNVILLNDISTPSNGLLSDEDVFKIRFRLELLGVGHKLYSETPLSAPPLTKDAQTVVFDVDDIFSKIRENSGSRNRTNPFAYTRFTLKHEGWFMDTKWSAELHKTGNSLEIEDDALSLHIILEECPWAELYASFHVEVWDFLNKRVIQNQGTPINNFVKDRITIDPLMILTQLKEIYDEDDPISLRFKLQFVVYGHNARYYSDVV